MGFIEGRTVWLAPGVALVVLSKWIAARYSGKAISAS
jgi:hypothetical protein